MAFFGPVTHHAKYGGRQALAMLFVLFLAAPVLAEIEPNDPPEEDAEVVAHEPGSVQASLYSGYRFVTPDGPVAAAAPYGRFKSGVVGGFAASSLGRDLKLSVDGAFLHEDDYHTELISDYAGKIRIHAEAQAMWHNLLREQINPGSLALVERDRGAEFGMRVSTTQLDSRLKLGNNPFHINLGYWELRREGYEQLRFSDHYFGSPTGAIVTDIGRVDRVTREGSFAVDGHLRWTDLSYEFRLRDFANEAADPRFTFTSTAGNLLIPGNQAHDVIPNSRVTTHTIKAYSDLSGGLVGSAAYILTRRENTGGHGEATPSQRPTDTLQTIAGDVSYTPFKQLSMALKYRHQQIDRDTPATVSYPFAVSSPLAVRPSSDTSRDTVIFSTVLRPGSKAVYRLEYRADLEQRNDLRQPQSPLAAPFQLYADSRQTHTGIASFNWRPYNGIKLNASYSYAACDNPAYAAAFSTRQTGRVIVTYLQGAKWGITSSYQAQYENAQTTAQVVPPATLTVTPATVASQVGQPRESRSDSATGSFWFSPLERLTVTATYSFLQSQSDQTLLFTSVSQNALLATHFRSRAHVYGVDALYAASEQLDLSLGFQQVQSSALLGLPDRSFTTTAIAAPFTVTDYSTAGITDLTRLDATETAVSAHADWRVTPLLSCGLDYSFRIYDSGIPALDGAVHATMFTIKARW